MTRLCEIETERLSSKRGSSKAGAGMLLAPRASSNVHREPSTGMADIRLARPRGTRVWLWVGLLAVLGLGLWSTAFFIGDATDPAEQPKVGAALNVGEQRAPVLPVQPTPFQSLDPLRTRDLGRLVRLTGVAESPTRRNSVWVRTSGGRRILVRFEPAPADSSSVRFSPGSAVAVDGYVENISRAEFVAWMDTLGVQIPQPPPGRKFGDLPDPAFARVDSLFVKTFYLSVRPEGVGAEASAAAEPGS